MKLYIGLLHYPVYNKNKDRIASAVTNLDLHDLSRLARTYGVKSFFLITPLEDQLKLAGRILKHWISGYGAKYNSLRKAAIEVIKIVPSLDDSILKIRETEGEDPLLIATDASERIDKSITYSRAVDILNSNRTLFILFGTAWGLHEEVIERADFILEPIRGRDYYNHLSVRTAAGIILDRLAGRYE